MVVHDDMRVLVQQIATDVRGFARGRELNSAQSIALTTALNRLTELEEYLSNKNYKLVEHVMSEALTDGERIVLFQRLCEFIIYMAQKDRLADANRVELTKYTDGERIVLFQRLAEDVLKMLSAAPKKTKKEKARNTKDAPRWLLSEDEFSKKFELEYEKKFGSSDWGELIKSIAGLRQRSADRAKKLLNLQRALEAAKGHRIRLEAQYEANAERFKYMDSEERAELNHVRGRLVGLREAIEFFDAEAIKEERLEESLVERDRAELLEEIDKELQSIPGVWVGGRLDSIKQLILLCTRCRDGGETELRSPPSPHTDVIDADVENIKEAVGKIVEFLRSHHDLHAASPYCDHCSSKLTELEDLVVNFMEKEE